MYGAGQDQNNDTVPPSGSGNIIIANQDDWDVPTNQIIVKYQDQDSELRINPASIAEVNRLSAAAGVALTYAREMSGGAHVFRLPSRMGAFALTRITEQISALPEVAYAEADQIMQHTATPNDPFYPQQWHYFVPTEDNYGINLPPVWDLIGGLSSVVVAVIDTGITGHMEFWQKTVPGYDFITDVWMANDGDGRDPDPSDPGDWVPANACYTGSLARNSSWHGTHVAGTIAAASNNGIGVAGVDWNAKILPVRVLGRCGGYTSDIVDGMRWAAGLSITGVPPNINPAKVLNLSLGGSGSCGSTYQTAIDAINEAGATVVVAAGNSNLNASGFRPANCNDVITVAATNRAGSKASYSNFGAIVEISAPGGETNPTSSDGIYSTLNTGTTSPVDDSYAFYQGTSMAAPHVSGVASLLYSAYSSLQWNQVNQLLQDTATPFPDESTCTTAICGSGIVNAYSALQALFAIEPPPAPTGVSASEGTYSDKVEVTWNASSTATRYEVYRNTRISHDGETLLTSNSTGSPYDDFSADYGQVYYYWVKACNVAGCSDYSSPGPGFRALPPPTNVAASDGTFTDRIQITWTDSLGATYYRVYQYELDDPNNSPTVPGNPTTSPHDSFIGMPGKLYYFWVKACNAMVCSDWSASDTGYRALSPPTGLTASKGTFADKVQITWILSSGADFYAVIRNTTNSHSGETQLDKVESGTFDDTTGTLFQVYYYWIIACNSMVCSDYSVSDTGYRALSPPTGVTASDGTFADKVQITWILSSGVDFYEVFRNTTNSHSGETQLDTVESGPYNDTTATPGQVYYYWIKACNSKGCSNYSSSDSGFRALPPPTNVTASNGTFADKVQITWNLSSGAEFYEVFRNTTNSHTGETKLNKVESETFDDTTATPGQVYYYWVKACNSMVCSDYSDFAMGSLRQGYMLFLPLIIK